MRGLNTIFNMNQHIIRKLAFIIVLIAAGTLCAQPADSYNKYLLAQSYEQAGQPEKALSIYAEIYNAWPQNPEYFQAYNNLLVKLKKYDKSIEIIKTELKLKPADINLHGLLGKTYFMSGDDEEAFRIWENYLETYAANPVEYKVISNLCIEQRAYEKAAEILRKGNERFRSPAIFSYEISNLYYILMQYRECARELLSLLKADPNQYGTVENRFQFFGTKEEAVKDFIAVLEEENSSFNPGIAKILSRLYYQNKNYAAAVELDKEIDSELKESGSALVNLAQRLSADKQYRLSVSLFRYLLETYPQSGLIPGIKIGLARALEESISEERENSGDAWKPLRKRIPADLSLYKEAITLYTEIQGDIRNPQLSAEASLRLGILYKQTGDYDKALDYLLKIGEEKRNTPYAASALMAAGEIYLLRNNFPDAINAFSNVQNTYMPDPQVAGKAKYMLMQCYFFKGDLDKASEVLGQLMINTGDDVNNDALRFSLILNKNFNDSLSLVKFAMAEYLVFTADYSGAEKLFRELSLLRSSLLIVNISGLRLAEIETVRNNYTEALAIANRLADDPVNLYGDKALMLAADICSKGLNDAGQAIAYYEKLLIKYPASIYLDKAREEINNLKKKSI
ncbi:MAG: tetratricopeptide repeat protein [Ignavibacteriaceae bacterium]|nr:tetratricopeptide repeat protein [Ignavibacteriaceae bacterium]